MLILRVASRKAWKSDTATRTMAIMQFERRTDPTATSITTAGLSTIDKDTQKLASLKDEGSGCRTPDDIVSIIPCERRG